MQQRRVLVVDDEDGIRTLLSNVFRAAGYAVDSAGSGHEAFEKLDAEPDLVTVDLMMPDVTGWELIEQVCSRPRAPLVVVVSGRHDFETHPLRGCVAGVVHKPFVPRDLLDACDLALRARDKQPPSDVVERRRVRRRDLVMDVRAAPTVGAPMLNGRMVQLSPLGAEVEFPSNMATGDMMRLAMLFPGRNRPVLVDGKVRYCAVRGGVWACGLEFANLPLETRQELSELLDIPAPSSAQ
jgi:DNA-binding response OmpR family regulator